MLHEMEANVQSLQASEGLTLNSFWEQVQAQKRGYGQKLAACTTLVQRRAGDSLGRNSHDRILCDAFSQRASNVARRQARPMSAAAAVDNIHKALADYKL